MRDETVQDVVRVLPNALGHDERRIRIDGGKDLHAFLLRTDEAVFDFGFVGVGPLQFPPEISERFRELTFHGDLGRPAFLIGRAPEVAVDDQSDGAG